MSPEFDKQYNEMSFSVDHKSCNIEMTSIFKAHVVVE